ncbi:MAG: hypothetical protein ACOYKE_14805, partial [Ferruginibacter sp.]
GNIHATSKLLKCFSIDNARVDIMPVDNTPAQLVGVTSSKALVITNKVTQVTPLTLDVDNWNLADGLYEYDLANAAIQATSIVDVIPENDDIDIVIAAVILPKTLSSAGSVKLYAKYLPTDDIDVTINIL